MRNLLRASLVGSSLLLAAAANAPYRSNDGDRDYRYSDRGDYRGGSALNRVWSDLERAEANSHPNGGDRRRFAKVREELSEFQRSGNPRELNDTVGALQRVVSQNRLSYRDRDILADDLNRLREFRGQSRWR